MTEPVSDTKSRQQTRKAAQSDRNNVQIAYKWIKSKILSGELKSGEQLPQASLAKQCNTSRGPIREALRLLQNEGLVIAETNQRGRVASFEARDLAQIVASVIVNAGFAIACHGGAWSPADVKRIEKLIDEHEALNTEIATTARERSDLARKRQAAYRKIVSATCPKKDGPIQQILANHFDRIAIFRQVTGVRIGASQEFPLNGNMEDLRQAVRERNASAAALAIVTRSATLGRAALAHIGKHQLGYEIDKAVAFIQNALESGTDAYMPRQIRTTPDQKVSVQFKGAETLVWTFSND